ncbi:MAG: ATP-dependent Clp protease proteolytic subunit [Clostridia bacterium]|nr:ATP-dependent Clp protease proteolytic subunit [Clostridia bacterium]
MTEEKTEEVTVGKREEEDILQFGATLTQGEKRILTLVIAGQIEGHQVLPPPAKATRYEHVLPMLVKAEESPEVEGVLFLLNTVGGDVEAGLAMAEMIAGMKKPTVSLVLGGGHSIGIPLAVAADHSFIVPSATMTVHPVRMTGLVLGVPQSFEYLRRMQDRICDFITTHSTVSRRSLDALMAGQHHMATDIGTILCGAEAVAAGLVEKLGSFGDAMDALKAMIKSPKA